MGKKCVQNVCSVRTKLGISGSYTQHVLLQIPSWWKDLSNAHNFPRIIHSLFSKNNLYNKLGFYPFSTEPIITTICIYNKRQVRVDLRSML